VDARLHHLQGKAELVKPADLLELLREFYADKGSLRQRHAAAARHVPNYDFNNTYQYIINREDVQLAWLQDAIAALGGTLVQPPEPAIATRGKGNEAQTGVIREDSVGMQSFFDRWRERVEKVTNARHRTMLRVILGETLEHKRFFDQMLAGRLDLLGRAADGARTAGEVIATRWVE
jgi:hypothetical protein